MAVKARKLTMKEAHQVGVMIGANGKAYEDGSFEYNDGWDDRRIATELDIPVSAVGSRRRAIYGDVRPRAATPADEIGALKAMIEDLRGTICDLKQEMQERMSAIETAANGAKGSTP
jgi:hypothetical protein